MINIGEILIEANQIHEEYMNKSNRNLNKKVDITHIIQMFMTRKYMIIIKGGQVAWKDAWKIAV